jgi:hypothetical protein
MTCATNYVSVPFFRSAGGGLVAGDSKDAPNVRIAEARAEGLVGRQAIVVNPRRSQPASVVVYIGAIAFARSADSQAQEMGEHTILARFGQTPESLAGFA